MTRSDPARSVPARSAPARSAPDCSSPVLSLSSLFARDPAGGVLPLFAGRRVDYCFKTRVGIRQACDLLGLRAGDEVLAPAYNCGSELDPLRVAGLTVTLFDVDRQTRIDPAAVERRITPRTRAVYLIHYFGFLHPDAGALRALCDRHGLWLIEDCALSLLSGAAVAQGEAQGGAQGGVAGRTGDVALFCFYKFFPVLAGGALVINSDRIPGAPGFAAAPPAAYVAKQALRAALAAVPGGMGAIAALKARLRPGKAPVPAADHDPDAAPDMPASYYFDPDLTETRLSRLALWPLRSFDVARTIATRRANYRTYLTLLQDLPGVTPLFPDLPADTCPLCMPVLVENRDALAAGLEAQGIAATPWWAGYNRHLDFSGMTGARYLKAHVLSLPLHQPMDAAHVGHVVARLRGLMAAPDRDPAPDAASAPVPAA